MTPESQDDLDRRIKELEREKREEELRQLKTSARARWVTPAALVALLPLLGGFGLWVVGEVKQYGEGYRALKERDALRQEKEALQRQKDSLNVEIGTLLQLKEHYAGEARALKAESEARQEAVDRLYLRAVSMSAGTVYALDHVKGMGPGPDRKALDAVRADLKQLPKESAARVEDLLQRHDLMATIIGMSREMIGSFDKALALIPASDWARRLRPMPPGPEQKPNLMVGDSPDGPRYYDMTAGRFLTKEEAAKIR